MLINGKTNDWYKLYPLYCRFAEKYSGIIKRTEEDFIRKASDYAADGGEALAYIENNDVKAYAFYYKTEECEMYPEASLCTMYKDTSDVTEKEFKEEMKAYAESLNSDVDDPSWFEIIISYFLNYGIYILLPIVVLSIFYLKKIHVVKKNERKK